MHCLCYKIADYVRDWMCAVVRSWLQDPSSCFRFRLRYNVACETWIHQHSVMRVFASALFLRKSGSMAVLRRSVWVRDMLRIRGKIPPEKRKVPEKYFNIKRMKSRSSINICDTFCMLCIMYRFRTPTIVICKSSDRSLELTNTTTSILYPLPWQAMMLMA